MKIKLTKISETPGQVLIKENIVKRYIKVKYKNENQKICKKN